MNNPDLIQDIADMGQKFGVNAAVRKLSPEMLYEYVQFRIGCLEEELEELKLAKTGDDAVDAIIDLLVFGIGTLSQLDVDVAEAWRRVHAANMTKSPGIKPGRPNPWNLPDLVKSADWKAPDHHDNVGLFSKIMS